MYIVYYTYVCVCIRLAGRGVEEMKEMMLDAQKKKPGKKLKLIKSRNTVP